MREGGIRSEGKWGRGRERCLCVNSSRGSLMEAASHWPAWNPPVWRKYHQGNFVLLPLCMFSSLPGLFLNSIRLPALTEDYEPQHPYLLFSGFARSQIKTSCSNVLLFSSSTVTLQTFCKNGGWPTFCVQCSWLWTGESSLCFLWFQVCACVCCAVNMLFWKFIQQLTGDTFL